MRVQRRCLIAILLTLGCVNPLGAFAQQTAGQEKKPAPKLDLVDDLTPRVTVFYLQMVEAESTANILQKLISKDARVAVDARTNGLIVSATEADTKAIKLLLEVLDSKQAPHASKGPEIKLFTLKQPIDSALSEVIDVIKSPGTNVALDRTRNVVIAKGNPDELTEIEATLSRLDAMYQENVAASHARAAQRGKLSARFVWLIAGLEEAKLKAPPGDLKPVIDELSKIGVSELRLAAQMLVDINGDSKSPFSATGVANLDRPANLRFSGVIIESKDDRIGLEIQISAEQDPPPVALNEGRGNPSAFMQRGRTDRFALSHIQTTILTRPGHAVVLGVTPAGDMTSVFVVQLRDGQQ